MSHEELLAAEWANELAPHGEFSDRARSEMEKIIRKRLENLFDELSSEDLLAGYYQRGGA